MSAVEHPKHYGGEDNPYEAIKVIEAWDLGFHLGNVVKYIARAGKKDAVLQELKKARWYLDRKISRWRRIPMAPDINTRCKCGHPNGEHYSKSGWPACSQCEDCREFKPAAEFYTDLGADVSSPATLVRRPPSAATASGPSSTARSPRSSTPSSLSKSSKPSTARSGWLTSGAESYRSNYEALLAHEADDREQFQARGRPPECCPRPR